MSTAATSRPTRQRRKPSARRERIVRVKAVAMIAPSSLKDIQYKGPAGPIQDQGAALLPVADLGLVVILPETTGLDLGLHAQSGGSSIADLSLVVIGRETAGLKLRLHSQSGGSGIADLGLVVIVRET